MSDATNPRQTFEAGQQFSVMSDDKEIATGIIFDFDPTSSTYKPSGMSKAQRPPADHWHISLRDSESGENFPAAIYDNGEGMPPRLGSHFTRIMMMAEMHGQPLAYSSEELREHIGAIASRTTAIIAHPKPE